MLEKRILRLKNNSVYQELKSYYGQSTVFSALGIERNENRHSAFLCWLMNPVSDHQLGTEPLKKFLALYASMDDGLDMTLRAALVNGRFDIENVQMETEVSLSRFCSDEDSLDLENKQKRLDIWAEFSICLPDAINSKSFALIIENKIYSKEGVKGGKHQTDVYHDCLSRYYHDQTLLEVYLSPETEGANCPDFFHLTYQQLLDDVLMPLTSMAMNEHAKMLVNDYIRNLGRPALNDDDKSEKTYSILATSPYEFGKLQQLLCEDGMKEMIENTLIAVYGERARRIVGKDAWKRQEEMTPYEVVLLSEFWNANTELLKAMLHNLNIFPDAEKEVERIFKESNRDNTKYVVERQEDGVWVPADNHFKKPVAKGRAACVFFTQWMMIRGKDLTLEEVRNAFPVSINKYYQNNKWDILDTLIYGVETRSQEFYVVNQAGKSIRIDDAKWDFYPVDGRQCGWGYLKNHERAVMPKMWRRDDFQLLLDHIKHNQHLFNGLRIRQA